jgi:hypothetical protein
MEPVAYRAITGSSRRWGRICRGLESQTVKYGHESRGTRNQDGCPGESQNLTPAEAEEEAALQSASAVRTRPDAKIELNVTSSERMRNWRCSSTPRPLYHFFQFSESFQPHYEPGIASASKRNKYQKSSWS